MGWHLNHPFASRWNDSNPAIDSGVLFSLLLLLTGVWGVCMFLFVDDTNARRVFGGLGWLRRFGQVWDYLFEAFIGLELQDGGVRDWLG
jgi:hypothetical protein